MTKSFRNGGARIGIGVGLILLGFSFFKIYQQISLLKNGIPSVAEITSVQPQPCRNSTARKGVYPFKDFCADFTFNYTIKNQLKSVTFIYDISKRPANVDSLPFDMDGTLKVGNRYNILVDPDNTGIIGPPGYDRVYLFLQIALVSIFIVFGSVMALKNKNPMDVLSG